MSRRVSEIAVVVSLLCFSSVVRAEVPYVVWEMHGTQAAEEFGCEAANVGDVNGDGYADLLVGAYRLDLDGFGRGHLYFGGAEFDTIADVIFVSEELGDGYAESLAGAGDLNDDGFSDMMIGAPANDEGGGGAGKVYIYFGGEVVDSLTDVGIHGYGGGFASRLAGCGDVNMDGYDDIVIGAYGAGGGEGEAYVYFGGSPMDTLVGLYLEPGGPHDAFGLGVCGGEDVNGDGFADIVVGDPHYSTGRAYVYFGGPLLDPWPDLVLQGEDMNSHFGFDMAMCDLDNEAGAEIIVAAYMWSSDNGRVYVYRGGEALDAIPDLKITGQEANQRLGGGIVAGVDLNCDGCRDLCVWASYPDRCLIHMGESRMDRVEEVVVVSPGAWGDCFGSGRALFSSSDSLTGDGIPDLVIGASGSHVQGMYWAGKVYFFSLFDAPVELLDSWPDARRVPAGGQLGYTVVGTAPPPERETCLVWSEVLKPDGFWYEGNPLWGPLERTVAAGDTVTVELTQRIPYATPPGQYSWTVRVGSVYPDSVWDSSSFEFKVVEP